MIYRFLRLLFGLATRAFFSEIALENFERIPESGPVLLLPNHPNGLVDPFLILINLKRPVSLTAKATLKKNPLIALLFKAGKVVALQRRQDQAEGADMGKNIEALAEARKRLKDGGAVCLFPEGISHNEPQVQPLKTGAARIALEYVDVDGDPGGLKIIPVGIDYFDKQGFRSSVVVRVAEPIEAGAWRRANPQGDAHALMDAVEEKLRQNTLNFEKRKESVIIAFAAELFLTRGIEPARVGKEAENGRVRIGAIESIQRAYEAAPTGPAVEALGARIRAHMARLRRLGVHPREVFIDINLGSALLFSLREFGVLLLGLPMALWGMLNHLMPYAFCVAVKNIFGRERDVRATYAIFGAVLAFPLYYLLALVLLFTRLPLALAAAWALSLPLSLWAWLKFRDHFMGVMKRSFTFLLFVARPALRRELVAEEKGILAEISAFLP